MRHRLWDLLPGFPKGVDPDDPEHLRHPVVSSLTCNGGVWKGIQVGWVLADPRTILDIGPGTDPAAAKERLNDLARSRERLIRELETKNAI
ncbi:MAG: hypothetical protein WD274_03510 [Acidimicrobiia bacterium]